MMAEAVSAGFYEHKTNRQRYPRLQLRTVKELMEGKGIERPSTDAALDETFKKAPKEVCAPTLWGRPVHPAAPDPVPVHAGASR